MGNFNFTIDWANHDFVMILLGFLNGLIIFFAGRWLTGLIVRSVTRSMERVKADAMVIRFSQILIYTGLMGTVIIAALNAIGVQTISLTAILASAGVALSLAIKDSLANLASGLLILISKPYRIDDAVDAGGTSGTVHEVRLFHTVLRTADNVKVIVPNSAVVNGNIKNYSAYDQRRVDLEVNIGYENNIGTVRDLLMNIMNMHPLVLPEPAPQVEVLNLQASAVTLALRAWVRTPDHAQVRGELLELVKIRFDEIGIVQPVAQQEIHLRNIAE